MMDYSQTKTEVFEVNEDGNIINNYLWNITQINEAIRKGRNIIQSGWGDKRLFEPKWDFVKEEWVEGLSDEEVERRLKEIELQQNKPSESDILTLAILELAVELEKLKGDK